MPRQSTPAPLGSTAPHRSGNPSRHRGFRRRSTARERLEPELIRIRAIAQIGELGNAGSEEILAVLLGDASASVRSQANAALERVSPTERTHTTLLALRSTFTEISGPAASFLVKHGDSEMLVARMTDISDDSVRQQLRRGLIRRRECPRSRHGSTSTA